MLVFLRDENVRISASKIFDLNDVIFDSQKASDFDVFNVLCEYLYLFAGHPIRENFLNLLSKYLGNNISVHNFYDFEYRKKLWQKLFCDGDIVLSQNEIDVKFEYLSYEKEKNILYLNSSIDLSCKNIYELLDNTLGKLKYSNCEAIYFDARNIEFERPDDFHAQQVYEDLKNNCNDASLLELWLLCRVLMNTDLALHLEIERTQDARDILNLIFRLGLLPNIKLEFDISKIDKYDQIYALLKNYNKKNISLKISCSKENSDEILSFLNAVPLLFVDSADIDLDFFKFALSFVLSKEEVSLAIYRLYTVK